MEHLTNQRLNEDICQLSTLCSQNNSQCNSLEQEETSESILRMLQNWNELGYFKQADIKILLASFCIENMKQPEETGNKHAGFLLDKPIKEIRQQCEFIEKALNVFNNLENIVRENPLLLQYKIDLENLNVESNKILSFYTTSKLPFADSTQDQINANDSSATLGNVNCNSSGNEVSI